jgi:hypothetical protein
VESRYLHIPIFNAYSRPPGYLIPPSMLYG